MTHTPLIDKAAQNDLSHTIDGFFRMQCRYQGGIREICTKLEILDDEFNLREKRNPIHHMESRIKSPQSIISKLRRKGLPLTVQSAMENLSDIAGVRVICSYIDDIYIIAELLTSQSDVTLIKTRDYIKQPKENGYRSLHLILSVPVFLKEGTEDVVVEVQIRTIAMDFWASLEHSLRYKDPVNITEALSLELKTVAEKISTLDREMQAIRNKVALLEEAQENL